MFYLAFCAACLILALATILGGVWLLKKIADCSADYLPPHWDFTENKEREIR